MSSTVVTSVGISRSRQVSGLSEFEWLWGNDFAYCAELADTFELQSTRDMPKEVDVAIDNVSGGVPEEGLFDFEITDELRALASGYESIGDRIRQGGAPAELLMDLFFHESNDD